MQFAGIKALTSCQSVVQEIKAVYQERRDIIITGLRNAGLPVDKTKGTFYIWVRCPDKFSSEEFSLNLLRSAGIVVTPGKGFGKYGEGYIRLSLTSSVERLEEAMTRLKKLNF